MRLKLRLQSAYDESSIIIDFLDVYRVFREVRIEFSWISINLESTFPYNYLKSTKTNFILNLIFFVSIQIQWSILSIIFRIKIFLVK